MTTPKNKIGIITTVSNWKLYKKTIKFFPSEIQIFAMDGSNNFFGINSITFFLDKLKKYNIDWLIMADEDVIFKDHNGVFELIDYLSTNNYSACGMRDGGMLKWRDQNPYLLNTFFAILNLKDIYKIYDEEEMRSNQFIDEGEFDLTVEGLPFNNYQVDSLFEPYYCFFLWLLRKGRKIKYVNGFNPENNETTIVLNHNDKEILYHTWYARLYNKDEVHTERINRIINKGLLSKKKVKPIILKKHKIHWNKLIKKQWNRIINKATLLYKLI
tara:strand:+ start:15701 stop:16513 length:813 start_codon:yes stop_codon:yes gene_type:complete